MTTERIQHIRKADRDSLWFLGDNVQIIFDASHTEGKLLLAWQHMAPGATPPLHEHAVEDEMFFLLEGSITYWSGDREFTAGPGDAVLLPVGVPHTLQADPEAGAKFLLLTSPTGFEDFLRAVSEPATYDGPQRGWQMDEETARKLGAAAEQAKITIIAPPGTRP
ncbi:cupin domain-containing protein [Amycolatopsis jejuensis]|uniref:cupin domain-containing protein n=1 Tax=Amycolatopsis jejuensis TaxID=330084 RepID=UPI00068B8211|nr:cupin domain-containing protein [Amycolatopsis jejuensis]